MIDELNIDLLDKTESDYRKERAEYIADSIRKWEHKKDRAEADWDKMYPDGFNDWVANRTSLNARGEQRVIDKLNEVVRVINKLAEYPQVSELLRGMLDIQGENNE